MIRIGPTEHIQNGPFHHIDRPHIYHPVPSRHVHNHILPGPRVFALGLLISNGDLISSIIIARTPGEFEWANLQKISQCVRNLKKYVDRVSRYRIRNPRKRGEILERIENDCPNPL